MCVSSVRVSHASVLPPRADGARHLTWRVQNIGGCGRRVGNVRNPASDTPCTPCPSTTADSVVHHLGGDGASDHLIVHSGEDNVAAAHGAPHTGTFVHVTFDPAAARYTYDVRTLADVHRFMFVLRKSVGVVSVLLLLSWLVCASVLLCMC